MRQPSGQTVQLRCQRRNRGQKKPFHVATVYQVTRSKRRFLLNAFALCDGQQAFFFGYRAAGLTRRMIGHEVFDAGG